jgi:ribonuclease VapC
VIVVDTSAVIAIVLAEPGHQDVSRRLLSAGEKVISPMSLVESVMVLSRTFSEPKQAIESYLQRAGITQCVVDELQARWAADAFLLYGKGRHSARLNLGDCFSYAAAKALNAPLLYVGGDFAQTDIVSA